MSAPPAVGVPALVWWPSGPSTRICLAKPAQRTRRMKAGMMITTIAKASRIPWISSTVTAPAPPAADARAQGVDHRLERRSARRLHEDGVARPQERPQERDGLVAVGHHVDPARVEAGRDGARGDAGGRRADDDELGRDPAAAAPTARWPSSWPGPSSRISPSTATGRPGSVASTSSAATIAGGEALYVSSRIVRPGASTTRRGAADARPHGVARPAAMRSSGSPATRPAAAGRQGVLDAVPAQGADLDAEARRRGRAGDELERHPVRRRATRPPRRVTSAPGSSP